MISSALLFASTAISGTMSKMYAEKMKQYFGTADISITANQKSTSFPVMKGTQDYRDHFEYIIGAFQGSAIYKPNISESVSMSLFSINYDDLQTMNPFDIYMQSDLKPFSGKKIIISRNTAEKYNLSAGDYLDLTIYNNKYKYLVCAIAQPSGLFADDGMNIYAAVPKDNLSSIYNAKGREGMIYLKLKNPSDKKELINLLSKEYPKHSVSEPFSQEELDSQTAPLTMSFLLMTVIVFFMSAFIIYSSFKVLTVERLPVIGTFRSIGATRKMTDIVLLTESVAYSILGGLLGCGLGIGILYIMSYMSRPVWQKGFVTTVEFSLVHFALAFMTAIFLGFISSILPIIKISKIPVKDIILNSIEKKHSKKKFKLILAILSICIAVIIPPLVPPTKSMPLLVLCMLLSILSVILFVPYLTNLAVRVFEKLYFFVFGNEGVLAAKNLRDNKSIVNNISLLAIGLSSLLMINIVSFSVGKEVGNIYNDRNFDIWLSYYNSNRNFEKILQTVEGVESLSGAYELNNVDITNKDAKIMIINGINKNSYSDFWEIHILGNKKELLDKLDEGRYILISKALKEKFGVKEGDFLDLGLTRGVKSYKVIGFFNTLMYNGDYAVTSDRFLKADAGLNYYSQFFIKTTLDPDVVEKNILNKFPKAGIWSSTMDKMEELNAQSNKKLFSILNGFSVMSLIIGIFGILNNFVISFMERKRWLAVYRSVGMNKFQIVKMLFIESLTGGIIGGLAGIASGFVLVLNTGYVLKAMSLPVSMHLSASLFVNSLLGGIIITLLASISPALKSSKMNIIESVKYE